MKNIFSELCTEINIIDVIAILILLILATIFQFVLKELPCPLCLLQRIGLFMIATGFLMNLKFGLKPSHYAISIIAAVYTAAVALRQTLLHIAPGSDGYGIPILGMHLYTWIFTFSVAFIIWIAVQMLFDRQFHYITHYKVGSLFTIVINSVFCITIIICSINIVTTYMECGLKECPANPTHYIVTLTSHK